MTDAIAAIRCLDCAETVTAQSTLDALLSFVAAAEKDGWTLGDDKMWRCPKHGANKT